jgi:hypothetical protein
VVDRDRSGRCGFKAELQRWWRKPWWTPTSYGGGVLFQYVIGCVACGGRRRSNRQLGYGLEYDRVRQGNRRAARAWDPGHKRVADGNTCREATCKCMFVLAPYVKESRLDLFFTILFLGPKVTCRCSCGLHVVVPLWQGRATSPGRSTACLETWPGWTR